MRSRIIFSLPCLCALAAVFSGCTRRETAVQRGDRDQVLYRGLGYEISGLDPHLATGLSEYSVISALFEGLVAEDPVDLHPVPGVAESWEVSPDGLVYTFHLRAGAKWSNGEPVTAQDFVDSWRRALSPALAAPNASMLYVVRGAEDFNQGRLADFSRVGATAPDARTLRVTLTQPTPQFPAMLNQTVWFPVNLRSLAASGPPDARGNPWAQPGRLVGNGPFVLKSWRPGQEIVVEKSPAYWDAARVRLQAIRFFPFDSVDAAERAFRAGQLHLTETLPIGKIDAYRRESPQLLRTDPVLDTYFFRLNARRAPLNDERVRRALSLAIDRQLIVGKILRGGQQPATAFTPPGLPGYTPPAAVTTDFAEARRLLAAAGFPGGQGLPPIDLLYNTSENHRAVCEAVQEMWRRELGLEVRLVNEELKAVLADRQAGHYQILLYDWQADYLDAASFLDVWRGDSGNNNTGWSSADYDRLLAAAARTADPAARAALFQQAERLLLAAAPVIPLYFNTHVFLLQPAVKNWHPTLLDHHPYKYVYLEPN
ncbi:MAG TPA: peptide ABC transporter substrate-binding protein [Opitutaceae bacterium]|nr:peptide ABC transporter substrate-binding protein [Opitutaceae bacterium]